MNEKFPFVSFLISPLSLPPSRALVQLTAILDSNRSDTVLTLSLLSYPSTSRNRRNNSSSGAAPASASRPKAKPGEVLLHGPAEAQN